MPKKVKNKKKSKGTFKVTPDASVRFEDKSWYKAKFEEFVFGEGKYGEIVTLKFKIIAGELEDGEDAKGKNCTALVSPEVSPNSKLGKVITALRGKPLEVGDEVDLSAYFGKKIEVFIVDKGERPDGTSYQNVTDVRPIKKKKKKKK